MMCPLIPILLIFFKKLLSCSAQVNVFLQNNPVRYGKDLHLECSSLQYHSDWHWFKEDVLLFRNNLPASDLNLYKYKEKVIDDNHRQLIIHNFEFVDIGRYLCTNGIYEDFIDLSHESSNFIYFDNSTTSTVLQQETTFGISLTPVVSNVSPIPVCQLEIENMTFPLNISRTLPQEAIASVIFQPTMFNITFFCRQPEKTFNFVCDIGGLALEENVKKNCSDFPKRKGLKASSKIITVVASSCLLLIFSLGIFVSVRLKGSKLLYMFSNKNNPPIYGKVTTEDLQVERLEEQTFK